MLLHIIFFFSMFSSKQANQEKMFHFWRALYQNNYCPALKALWWKSPRATGTWSVRSAHICRGSSIQPDTSTGSQKDTGLSSRSQDNRTTRAAAVHLKNQGGRHLLSTALVCTNANVNHSLWSITLMPIAVFENTIFCPNVWLRKWPIYFPSRFQLLKSFVFQVPL